MSAEPGPAPKVIFDSDELSRCQCGSKTLLVEFFAGGEWTATCPVCGGYWVIKLL